jgi:signal transduction histidine kinase
MFTQPTLFKRLMLGVLVLGLSLWCLVLLFMVYNFKTITERFAPISLEAATQQQMAIFKAFPSDDAAIAGYASEYDALQEALYKKLSIFVARYYLQVWHGNQLIYSAANLPTSKPTQEELGRIASLEPTSGHKLFAWSEYDANTQLTLRILQGSPTGFTLSYRSVGYYLLPFIISGPFLFFPVWWALARGLQPLNRIAAEVVARTDADLSPISNSPYLELQPIVNALNRLMKKVGHRIQREQEFLHDAAHELKTPLAVIQLNSEILAGTSDPTTQQLALAGIQKGVARATHTTHQLLASARADNRQNQTEAPVPINLTQLLQDRLAQWVAIALQKDIEIELSAPAVCILNIYIESMSLLIDNLVDNAIKYSDNGSTIRVHLTDMQTSITLQVIDQGCGIPEAFREKVFERFFRIHQSDNPGTGLGLSIVKRAAQQHYASISLTDNTDDGRGLVATIEFPYNN